MLTARKLGTSFAELLTQEESVFVDDEEVGNLLPITED